MDFMKIRDMVRTAVIKTNPYPPFSSLNKVPYRAAIKTFVKVCESFPEIKTIYLRGGLSEGHFIPALSDIDLTVIIGPTVSVEREYRFLRSFWKRYRRMKKLFPMLGEIEILNSEELTISTKFGLAGYQAQSWKLLYGTEMPRHSYTLHAMSLRRDSLNHALYVYLEYFVKIFTSQKRSLYIVSQDLRRLQSKILRCLDHSNGANAVHRVLSDRLSSNMSNVVMFSRVLKSLDDEICRFNKDGIMANTEPHPALDPGNPPLHTDELLDLRELADCLDGAIKSVIVNSFNKIFVVLETALDAPTLKTCMETMIQVFPDKSRMPAIVSASMFEYILRHYEPFKYAHFMAHRRLVFGEDLLSRIQAPSRNSLIDYLLGRVPNLLTFPRSYTVILGYAPTAFGVRELECTVEQCLLLKLYLEKRVVQPSYDKLLVECENHYSEYFVELRSLKETRHANSSQEWFGFLRGLANDVRRCLTKLPDSVDCEYHHESHMIARDRTSRWQA
jgi:predicted nucleotidyltransferase